MKKIIALFLSLIIVVSLTLAQSFDPIPDTGSEQITFTEPIYQDLYHSVVPGNTAWDLAAANYGDPAEWRQIVNQNEFLQVNPQRLRYNPETKEWFALLLPTEDLKLGTIASFSVAPSQSSQPEEDKLADQGITASLTSLSWGTIPSWIIWGLGIALVLACVYLLYKRLHYQNPATIAAPMRAGGIQGGANEYQNAHNVFARRFGGTVANIRRCRVSTRGLFRVLMEFGDRITRKVRLINEPAYSADVTVAGVTNRRFVLGPCANAFDFDHNHIIANPNLEVIYEDELQPTANISEQNQRNSQQQSGQDNSQAAEVPATDVAVVERVLSFLEKNPGEAEMIMQNGTFLTVRRELPAIIVLNGNNNNHQPADNVKAGEEVEN